MQIAILEKNPDGTSASTVAATVVGDTYQDLVETMRRHSPFLEAGTTVEYIAKVMGNIGIQFEPKDDAEADCKAFVRKLSSHGLVCFMMDSKLQVPPQLWEAILLVKDCGETNMFDVPQVARLMVKSGFTQESEWITVNAAKYTAMILGAGRPLGGKACVGK